MSDFWSRIVLLLIQVFLKEKFHKDVVIKDDSSEVRKDSL